MEGHELGCVLHIFVCDYVMVSPVFAEVYEMVPFTELLTTLYYEQFANLLKKKYLVLIHYFDRD